MRVIGTAGHVDHGKSSLVKRLTDIDPDRLAEEKARAMTIDLGFAWLQLLSNEVVGIVDVPGHRDFIENMLAGVGGIDAVVFVIASDEGIMPQTREHLAILDLLGIAQGIITLTKCDLIDDAEWLDLLEQDIRDFVRGTVLEHAPIVRVSAYTGDGIPTLIQHLDQLLNHLPVRPNNQRPYLPIDRVFTMDGFGTVVTGTLANGSLQLGAEVELQPSGRKARIRTLQSYKQSVQIAQAGSRVAVNLSGVDKQEVHRGEVLTFPHLIQPTTLVDVFFRHLSDAEHPLKHNTTVKFFVGTSEVIAKVRLLTTDKLLPNESTWVQLVLEQPIACVPQQRFILRRLSPAQTIGGGVIVNTHPEKRWKRHDEKVLEDLQVRLEGTPAQRLTQLAHTPEPLKLAQLQQLSGYKQAELIQVVQVAIQEQLMLEIAEGVVWSRSAYEHLLERTHIILQAFYQAEPLRLAIPREELRSRLGIKNNLLQWLLETHTENFVSRMNGVALSSHHIAYTPKQQQSIDALILQFQQNPYNTPSYTEASQLMEEVVLKSLIEQEILIQVQPEILFLKADYEQMVRVCLQWIEQHEKVDAKALRDHFNSSRKYVIGLLEHLDSLHITKRDGDYRVKGSREFR
jgi:selenocysteine-specific elongation factor